jgi:two-component system, NtrC family, response regulator
MTVMKPKLLVVDDDEGIRMQLKYALRDDFVLCFGEDRPSALAALKEHGPTLVSLDLGLPPAAEGAEEGLSALDEIMKAVPSVKVVVVTGNADRENAVRALRLGACDYISKPIQVADLKVVLQRAAYLQELEAESEKQLKSVETNTRFEDILGNTPAMREIFAVVARVSKTDATVLVQGESGTGKELLAKAIHSNSVRKRGPFVAINCGAIPESLLESELFGHEKGAYTGAHIQRKGKLEVADGGTLFLDEIGDMPLPLQVKLLRFLQERQLERIGGRDLIRVDTRIIAATNKDLKTELQTGRFREDLYYRLSVVNVRIPPLRERGEDIVLIANAFVRRSGRQHRRNLRFSVEAIEALRTYQWPGNIRELENAVERAVIMAKGRQIEPADLGIDVSVAANDLAPLRATRDKAQREALVDALVKTRGNISQAAKLLGVSRPTFHGLLDKLQLNARDFR